MAKKTEMTPNNFPALVEIHRQWMVWERNLTAENDVERDNCSDTFDGITPSDDRPSSKNWTRDIRFNTIPGDVDLMSGELLKRRLYPKIYAAAGDADKIAQSFARLRDFQSRALFTASKFHQERPIAVKDALVTGEGFVRYGYRMDKDGRVKIFSSYTKWKNVIYDSHGAHPNGSVDRCRFFAHFSLVDSDYIKVSMPEKKDAVESVESPQEYDTNDSALDDTAGTRYPYTIGSTGGGYGGYGGGGGSEGRKFVVYGHFFYRDIASGRIMRYGFICDRSLTKMIPLSNKPEIPYSHTHYPFIRWVSGSYSRTNLPKSSIKDKIALSRIINYTLRAAVENIGGRGIIIEQSALPHDGEGANARRIEEAANKIAQALNSTCPVVVLGDGSISSKKMIQLDQNNNAKQLIDMVMTLVEVQGMSGLKVNPVLKGGGGAHASGVAIREHMDNAVAMHNILFLSDGIGLERAGEMNLSFIEDFKDKLPLSAYLGEDGEQHYLSDNNAGMSQEDMTLARMASGDLGVFVRPAARSPDVSTDLMPIITEVVKTSGGDPKIVGPLMITLMRELGFRSEMVENTADAYASIGANIPDSWMSEKGRESRAGIAKENQRQAAKQEEIATAAAAAKIDVDENKADKLGVEAAKIAAEIGTSVADANDKANASTGETMAQMEELKKQNAMLLQENAALKTPQ